MDNTVIIVIRILLGSKKLAIHYEQANEKQLIYNVLHCVECVALAY